MGYISHSIGQTPVWTKDLRAGDGIIIEHFGPHTAVVLLIEETSVVAIYGSSKDRPHMDEVCILAFVSARFYIAVRRRFRYRRVRRPPGVSSGSSRAAASVIS